jgi:DNA-binding HxlR family transcriptional regulator
VPPLEHLRLQELSDREVLLILRDQADADGYADVEDMGQQLGLDPAHQVRIITSRLTWLKRWGAVEREPADLAGERRVPGEPPPRRRWRMTRTGQDLALGGLRKRQQQALETAEARDLLGITQLLAERQRGGDPTVRNLVRREWQYRTQYAQNGQP